MNFAPHEQCNWSIRRRMHGRRSNNRPIVLARVTRACTHNAHNMVCVPIARIEAILGARTILHIFIYLPIRDTCASKGIPGDHFVIIADARRRGGGASGERHVCGDARTKRNTRHPRWRGAAPLMDRSRGGGGERGTAKTRVNEPTNEKSNLVEKLAKVVAQKRRKKKKKREKVLRCTQHRKTDGGKEREAFIDIYSSRYRLHI